MIIYNGVSLESIAPVRVVDILVSPIQQTVTNRPRPIQAGSDFVRMHRGTRTVAITFALLTNDMHVRQNQLTQIVNWAASDVERPLTIPNFNERALSCVCTAFPEPSTRQWWESKLRLVFTAYDNPYWTAINEKSASCGNTAFFVGGDAPPLMRIEKTLGASDSLTYSDGTDSMTFGTYTGRPTGALVIDLNRQTAAVGTTSIMQGFTFASKFILPKTGNMTITGSGTVKWRERWI